jgi:hypothetical protein
LDLLRCCDVMVYTRHYLPRDLSIVCMVGNHHQALARFAYVIQSFAAGSSESPNSQTSP